MMPQITDNINYQVGFESSSRKLLQKYVGILNHAKIKTETVTPTHLNTRLSRVNFSVIEGISHVFFQL